MGLYTGGSSSGGSDGGGLYRNRSPQRNAPAQAQPADNGNWLSDTLGSIGSAVSGVPQAVVNIGREAVKLSTLPDTALAGALGYSREDINSNPLLRNITNPDLLYSDTQDKNLNNLLGNAETAYPVTENVVRGFGKTAGELDPRGGFENLRTNYGQDPVGSALNDAANIGALFSFGGSAAAKGAELADAARLGDASFVAGPAGTSTAAEAAAQAGQASKLASALGKVAGASNAVASAPFKPYELLAKAPGILGERAYAASQDALMAGEKPSNYQAVVSRLSPLAKQVASGTFDLKANEQVAAEQARGTAIQLARILPDKTEQAAAFPVIEGTAPVLATLRKALPEDQFAAYVTDRTKGTLTPEAANLAADVVEGKNPELAARIQQVADLRRPAQNAYYAEHPEQAGYDPNVAAVGRAGVKADKAVADAQFKADALRAQADRLATFDVSPVNARAGAPDSALPISDPATAGNLRANVAMGALGEKASAAEKAAQQAERGLVRITSAAERTKAAAADAIKNAPARWEPILGESRAAVSHLTGVVNDLRGQGLNDSAAQVEQAMNEVAQNTSLKGIKESGAQADYLPHTQEARAAKGANPRMGAALPHEFTAGSERLRTGSPEYARSVEGIAQAQREAAVAQARRASTERIAAIPGVVAHLGEGPLASARTVEDAFNAGYVPWNPKTLFDTAGRVKPLDNMDAVLGVEHPTMFMPRTLFNQFRNYFEPARGQMLGLATDIPNRVFYLGRLALSPAYIVGRIGHAVLAPAGSGAPLELGHNLMEVVRSIKASNTEGRFLGGVRNAMNGEGFPEAVDPRVLKSGANVAEYERLTKDRPQGGMVSKASNALLKVASGPFHFAGMIDNLSRSAFYLTELGKKGAPEEALASTLRFMGEFDKAAPFERDYIRRVIPMWAWHREITKISAHLAADHPLRVAWTLHLGNSLGDPNSALPSFYDNSVSAGPLRIGAGMLFPFGEVGTEFKGPMLGAGKVLGPVPKLLYQNEIAPGINASTGEPFSRPGAATGPPTAPSLFKQITGIFPQSAVVDSLLGNRDTAQYSTGQEIQVDKPMTPAEKVSFTAQWHKAHPGQKVRYPKETIPSGTLGGALGALSAFAGVPLYSQDSIDQAAQEQAARTATKSLASVGPKKASSRSGGGLYRR